MQKKLLTLVLMLIAAINTSAYDFESNGIYYEILSKEKHTCAVTNQSETSGKKYAGNIVIPSTVQDSDGVDYTVSAISGYAFGGCVELQNVVIPNTVTEIGSDAFSGCSSLSNITFQSGHKKLYLSDYNNEGPLFAECSLDSVFIGRNLTIKTESSPFSKSKMLRSVYVSDSVTYIGKCCFRDCENLEHVYGMNKVDSIGEQSFVGTKIKKFCALV